MTMNIETLGGKYRGLNPTKILSWAKATKTHQVTSMWTY